MRFSKSYVSLAKLLRELDEEKHFEVKEKLQYLNIGIELQRQELVRFRNEVRKIVKDLKT